MSELEGQLRECHGCSERYLIKLCQRAADRIAELEKDAAPATSSERVSISRGDLAALHRDRVNALGQVGMSSDPLLERIEATLWSDSK